MAEIRLSKIIKQYNIGLQDLGHDIVHVVFSNTTTQFLASHASHAELDFLAYERNLLYIVPGDLGAFHEFVSEHIAV